MTLECPFVLSLYQKRNYQLIHQNYSLVCQWLWASAKINTHFLEHRLVGLVMIKNVVYFHDSL